ncbi:hypothetical protein [Sulfitobacter sp. SK025]|uniref:hypothetical protein n=1 Tax=Sulfitobacter sp. SK025 TaxID=1389011 RepID=UPI000E0BCAA9|nr:hypothetical protein [Sulfitobacter sp. SK025]AXI50405.1 hypothetical protein C1J04_05550 [Sulfitobacter sp. SK025]QDP59354.1 MAG: hypothetical protein GOVbin287_28 [Prokaryotic dsDNA virus sp.]|tara:strand:- start:23970 stop:24365 length:396 start_codon:yes stop_codon:yes gene_type:complete
MDWFSWFSEGQKLLGFIVLIVTSLAAVGRWFWGRVSTRVNDGMSGLQVGHQSIEKRLVAVEGSLGKVNDDLGRVRVRMSTIESRIDLLATAREQHDLAILVARIGASQEAQGNMVRMLYEAAQRAGKGGDK